MTTTEVINYAAKGGYQLTEDDAAEIVSTSYSGESVRNAVIDYLNAFEGGDIETRFQNL
jgi:hypothetical protein